MWGRVKKFLISLIPLLIVVALVFFLGRSFLTTSITAVVGVILAITAALLNFMNNPQTAKVVNWLQKNWSILTPNLPIQIQYHLPSNKDHFSILYHKYQDEDKRIVLENILRKRYPGCNILPVPWDRSGNFSLARRGYKRGVHCIIVLSEDLLEDLENYEVTHNLVPGTLKNELKQLAYLDGEKHKTNRGTLVLDQKLERLKEFTAETISYIIYNKKSIENELPYILPINYWSPNKTSQSSSGTGDTTSPQPAYPLVQVGPLTPVDTNRRVFIVSRKRNPFYIDRKIDRRQQPELMLQVLESKRQASNVQVLWGLIGSGKTQIALEYAYRYGLPKSANRSVHNPYQCVLWLDASLSVESGLKALNESLLADCPLDPDIQNEPDQYTRLLKWLKIYEKSLLADEQWLLIIDKCNGSDFKEYYSRFAQFTRGDVIFTMYERPDNVVSMVKIGSMTTEEGTLLLGRTAFKNPQLHRSDFTDEFWTGAEQLVDTLGGNPLAIDTAGAYITDEITPLDYLNSYNEHYDILFDQFQNDVFVGEMKELPLSIAAAFYVTLDKIEKDDAAYQLLMLCVFLELEPIPISIVNAIFQKNKTSKYPSLKLLNALSVIKIDPSQKIVHLQNFVRNLVHYRMDERRLTDAEKMESRIRAIRAVSDALPKTDADWDKNYAFYLPHIRKCVEYIEKRLLLDGADDVMEKQLAALETAVNLDIVHLLHSAGQYLRRHPKVQKTPAEAEHLLVQALRIRGKITAQVPSDCPDRATCLYELATFYFERSYHSDLPKLEQARGQYEEALSEMTSRLDVDAVTLRKHLGQVYYDLGMCDKAIKQYGDALKIIDGLEPPPTDNDDNWPTRVDWLFQRTEILYNRAEVLMKEGAVKHKNSLERAAAKDVFEQSKSECAAAINALNTAGVILQEEAVKEKASMDSQKISKKTSKLRQIEELQEELKRLRIRCKIDQDTLNMISRPVRIPKGMYREMKNNCDAAIKQARADEQRSGQDIPEEIYLQLITRHNNLGEVYRRWGRSHYQEARASYEEALGYYLMYYESYLKSRGEHHPIKEVIRDNLRTLPRKMIAEDQDRYQGLNL
jgi:tetratricopeptide (TPR) repeat protein